MTMSEKARAIADRPAFPEPVNDVGVVAYPGMTYHQLLVGQALAGLAGWTPTPDAAAWATQRADAVCEALAEREP